MRAFALGCTTFALAFALISCTTGHPNAEALLGKTIAECDATFGKEGMLVFTLLGDEQLDSFTGLVAPLDTIRFNHMVWPNDDSTYYCEVANGIVTDCFKASVTNGTRQLENSKTLFDLAPSERISSIGDVKLVSLPTTSPLGLAPVTKGNIPDLNSFSGMIIYRASYSRHLYKVMFKGGTVDNVNVTDIGDYGETAE